jgi:2'-hydroxyisoflavone reductase
MKSRREFLAASAAAGVGLTLGCRSREAYASGDGVSAAETERAPRSQAVQRAETPLKILFLGGTAFLGPAEVEYALARGHMVTLFNRGQTNPHLFPGVEKLVGDRDAPDLSALEGREWDVVIDNSANVAKWLKDTAELLQDSVGRYLFVSSISAHTDNSIIGQTEDAPVFSREDYDEVIAAGADFGTAFGPNKAEAERLTMETFGDRGLVVRPGLIVGPGDRSDRFTYWPVRIDRGGEVLAPGDGSDPTQIIDVRDLGRFIIHLVEEEASGTFVATGPGSELTMAGMLYGIRAVTISEAQLTWVDTDFLREHEVRPWMDMPVWMEPTTEMAGFSTYDISKAISAGLTFRPLADTARDTLEWWNARPEEERSLRFGIAPEKEAAVLEAWHGRTG